MSLEKLDSNKVFGGTLTKYTFVSESLGGLKSNLNVFLPPKSQEIKVPVLYYLAGLTCTEDNGAQKGHFFKAASENGLAIVFPDTSPRGAKIQGEDDAYDFGSGAGFYIDATKDPWSKNYRMYDHVTKELPRVISSSDLPIDTSKASILGHSMGGHGALTLYLKEPKLYRSASAFAPICNPTSCPWGQKAFQGYLQDGVQEGKLHDATELIRSIPPSERRLDILIDSGLDDKFYLSQQLLPERFQEAAREAGHDEQSVKIRLQPGYDHSCEARAILCPPLAPLCVSLTFFP
ncbi:S-formylglutathione hydrol [Violaceomyces palustris]|uniref:S-formylglutathione hydrol n=1 Tax=Violaceomyces palustris TaxID=1673888 RepID=A0ACD0NL84_9BASI|nr:S-formylglutathione hydrol [Violaceomyces palustris]